MYKGCATFLRVTQGDTRVTHCRALNPALGKTPESRQQSKASTRWRLFPPPPGAFPSTRWSFRSAYPSLSLTRNLPPVLPSLLMPGHKTCHRCVSVCHRFQWVTRTLTVCDSFNCKDCVTHVTVYCKICSVFVVCEEANSKKSTQRFGNLIINCYLCPN